MGGEGKLFNKLFFPPFKQKAQSEFLRDELIKMEFPSSLKGISSSMHYAKGSL